MIDVLDLFWQYNLMGESSKYIYHATLYCRFGSGLSQMQPRLEKKPLVWQYEHLDAVDGPQSATTRNLHLLEHTQRSSPLSSLSLHVPEPDWFYAGDHVLSAVSWLQRATGHDSWENDKTMYCFMNACSLYLYI